MDSEDRRFFRAKTCEQQRVGVRLNRRVVGHVDLFKVSVGHELAEVPQRDGAVDGGRREDVVVARKDEGGDHGGMVAEIAEQVAVGDVPKQDAVVAAAGYQETAVVGKDDGGDRAFVAGHQPDAVSGHAVP